MKQVSEEKQVSVLRQKRMQKRMHDCSRARRARWATAAWGAHGVCAGRADRRRAGITLVELLVVIGIILILAAISVPMIGRGLDGANRGKAMTEISSIVRATEAYQREYGRWPLTGEFVGGNAGLINILRAEDTSNNPRRYTFLSVTEDSLDEAGNFIDPWDNPYRIIIRSDGEISDPLGGGTIRRNVIAWSMGGGNDNRRALRTW